MHAHDGAHITSQVAAASRDGEVLNRVEAVCVNHKIAVILVYGRGLAAIPVVEEFGQGLALDVVDGVHVEPCAVARQDDGMRLGDEVLPRGIFDELLCLSFASAIGRASAVCFAAFSFWRVAHLLVLAASISSFGRVALILCGTGCRGCAILLDSRALGHLDICERLR